MPANSFRACEGKRSFRRSRKAGKKKRSRSGPTEQEMLPAKDERISLKNLTKPDYSMSAKSFFRDRQTDGCSRTSEDSTIIDAVLTPPQSLSDELRDRDSAACMLQRVATCNTEKTGSASGHSASLARDLTRIDAAIVIVLVYHSVSAVRSREAQEVRFVAFEATRGSPSRSFQQKGGGKRECSNSLSRFREAQ